MSERCDACNGYRHPLGHFGDCPRKLALTKAETVRPFTYPTHSRPCVCGHSFDNHRAPGAECTYECECSTFRESIGLDRPPREDYVRVTFDAHGFTFEPALEFRDGDDFAAIADALKDVATDPIAWEMPRDQMDAARRIQRHIEKRWPDRAYFVEVWQEGREGFAQVFQPFGVPRNR